MRKIAYCGEWTGAFLYWMALMACAIALAPSAVHGQESDSLPQARLLFERGFYAEHHEHDLDRAVEHYLLAAEMAERLDDRATAQRAREAHRLVLVRLGRLAPTAAPTEEPARAGKSELHELLERLRDAPGPVDRSRALALLEAGTLPPQETTAALLGLIEHVRDAEAAAPVLAALLDPLDQVAEGDPALFADRRPELETLGLRWIEPAPTRLAAGALLRRVGGIRTFEHAVRAGSVDHQALDHGLVLTVAKQVEHEHFARMIKAAAPLPADLFVEVIAAAVPPGGGRQLPPFAALTAALGGLRGAAREHYLRLVVPLVLEVAEPAPELRGLVRGALRSKAAGTRAMAMRLVGKTEDLASLPILVRALLGDDLALVEAAAAGIHRLARIDPGRVAAELRTAFAAVARQAQDTPIRWHMEALDAIGGLPGPDAVELIDHLRDGCHPAVRYALDRFLIEAVEGEDASAATVRRFAELDPELQVLALDRIARELYEPGIPLLGAAIRRGAPKVREAACRTFAAFQEHERFTKRFESWKRRREGGTAPPRTVQRLLGRLGSRDPEAVRRAAAALGEAGDPAALPALVRLLETDDPALRKTIEEALLAIVEKE